jgi:hypothetical protein
MDREAAEAHGELAAGPRCRPSSARCKVPLANRGNLITTSRFGATGTVWNCDDIEAYIKEH